MFTHRSRDRAAREVSGPRRVRAVPLVATFASGVALTAALGVLSPGDPVIAPGDVRPVDVARRLHDVRLAGRTVPTTVDATADAGVGAVTVVSTKARPAATTVESSPVTGTAAPAPGPGGPPAPPAGVIAGNDISWTQCSADQGGYANPMPGSSARLAVIGLGAGRSFTVNPCLADEITWASDQHVLASVYVLPTYPTNTEYALYGAKGPYAARSDAARLLNVGFQQASYWAAALKASGVRTPSIWVDVEKRSHGPQWAPQTARNLLVIKGLLAGLRRAGYRTGIYTPAAHWREITGGVRLGQPEWRTVGKGATPLQALATCPKPGNQGSPVLIAQYYTSNVDYDVLCPITRGTWLTGYFHQY
jgi:hypothetical protein